MKIFWSLLKVLLMTFNLYSDSISGQSESVKVKLYSKLYQYGEQLFQRLIPLNISDQKCFLLIWYDIIRNYLQLKKPQHIEQFSERWEMIVGGGSLNEVTTQVLDCSKCMVQLIFSIIQAKQSPFHIATMYVLKIWCCDFKTIIWRTSQKTNR